jgi:hypothetical protein
MIVWRQPEGLGLPLDMGSPDFPHPWRKNPRLVFASARNLEGMTRTSRGTVLALRPAERRVKPASASPKGRGPVVLLALQARDDALSMYGDYLRFHGLVPIEVSNSMDAQERAREADIIVTDIVLDHPTDGIELVSRLRQPAHANRRSHRRCVRRRRGACCPRGL